MKHCPICDGTNVQEFLAAWYWANGDEKLAGEMEIASLYSTLYWCDDCDTTNDGDGAVDHLIEKDEGSCAQCSLSRAEHGDTAVNHAFVSQPGSGVAGLTDDIEGAKSWQNGEKN